MTVRDLLHIGKNNVHVARGSNPIVAFQDEVNKLFPDFFGEVSLASWLGSGSSAAFAVTPAIDVTENDKEFKVTAELSGLDAKDTQITASEGYLTIKGEKKKRRKRSAKVISVRSVLMARSSG